MNANKTGLICFKWGAISTLNGWPLKLVDKFTYFISNISLTENDVNICQVKVWTAINSLLIIWKSDLSNKIKQDFFQVVAVSILLYRCTIWMLTKCMEKKLDGELHKNAVCQFEQILEALPKNTTAVWPLTSHLKNHWTKMNKTCGTLLDKQGQTHAHSSMDSYTWTCHFWLAGKNLHQLCVEIGCSLEDLVGEMNTERVRQIGAVNATWWCVYLEKIQQIKERQVKSLVTQL